MSRAPIRVVVVGDVFRVAALHAAIVDAVIGFETVARAGTIAQARQILMEVGDVDLALVDVHLPDGSGIELIRELRCDAFVVTAEDSANALRHGLTAGAMAYLIKPFENTELARRLAGYAQYRRIVEVPTVTQSQVDSAMSAVRGERPQASRASEVSQTEKAILAAVAGHDGPMVADQIAEAVGISAPTARRHLAGLVADGRLEMALRYGATGRPKQEYKIVNPA
jgi:two-component system CitB family response regulator